MSATDALVVLHAAARLNPCFECVCDVDGNGTIAASDALLALQAVVGVSVPLSCPDCGR